MKKKGNLGWKEWVDKTVSLQVGCENNCKYCWARVLGHRRGYVPVWDDWEKPRDKKQPDFLRVKYGVVGFPGTHDIHESNLEKSIKTIKILVDYGNNVILVTKGLNLIVSKLIDALCMYKDKVEFRFSFSTNYDDLIKKLEGNSPLYKEKKFALQLAFQRGFRTSISMEPYISSNLVEIINDLKEFVSSKIFFVGVMNHRTSLGYRYDEIKELEYLYTDETRKQIKEELEQIDDVIIRYKNEKSDWQVMGDLQ